MPIEYNFIEGFFIDTDDCEMDAQEVIDLVARLERDLSAAQERNEQIPILEADLERLLERCQLAEHERDAYRGRLEDVAKHRTGRVPYSPGPTIGGIFENVFGPDLCAGIEGEAEGGRPTSPPWKACDECPYYAKAIEGE